MDSFCGNMNKNLGISESHPLEAVRTGNHKTRKSETGNRNRGKPEFGIRIPESTDQRNEFFK